jgi:hypothetical protein
VQISNVQEDLQKWADRLRDPWRMRLAVTGLLLAVGYMALYVPLSGRLAQTMGQLNVERQRQETHQDVEFLLTQAEMFQSRIPEGTDANEWVQYVIDGVRQYPVKLVNLDSAPSRSVGPFRAVAMRLDLDGQMRDLDALMLWFETNERLFRIESAMIEPSREGGTRRSMHITLLGLKA